MQNAFIHSLCFVKQALSNLLMEKGSLKINSEINFIDLMMCSLSCVCVYMILNITVQIIWLIVN